MDYEQITNSLMSSYTKMTDAMFLFAPKILTVIILLILGSIISRLVARAVKAVLTKLEVNSLGEKVGLASLLVSLKMSPDLAHLISKVCSMFVYLIFLISAADVMEMEALSSIIDSFILYIPNIIGAMLVFFIASTAAHFAKQAIIKAGESLRLDFAGVLGSVAYFALMLIGVILAIGQLKIETAFLVHVIEILLVAGGAALALSLGVGSRDVSKNIISGVYLKDSLVVGSHVKLGDFEGELTAIKSVCFELQDSSGRTIILPNSRLLDCEIVQK